MDKLHWSAFKTIITNLFVSRSIICDPAKTKRKEANHNNDDQRKQQQRLLYNQHIPRPHSSQPKSPVNMNQIGFYLESIILLVSELWELSALNIRKYYTYSMYVWMLIDQHDLLQVSVRLYRFHYDLHFVTRTIFTSCKKVRVSDKSKSFIVWVIKKIFCLSCIVDDDNFRSP